MATLDDEVTSQGASCENDVDVETTDDAGAAQGQGEGEPELPEEEVKEEVAVKQEEEEKGEPDEATQPDVQNGETEPEMVKEEDFVWEDYLDWSESESVPQTAFSHVEQSLQSGFQEGMRVEVAHPTQGANDSDPDSYWVATVVMSCGPLLRLRLVGRPPDDRSQEFWCDVTKGQLRPLGWAVSHGKTLRPFENCTEEDPDPAARSVPAHLLSGEGLNAVERVRQGMKVEVEDRNAPYKLWVGTIVENVGGRLLIRYDTPGDPPKDFWLFYLSPRLFPVGWGRERGPPWSYGPPIDSAHGPEEWDAVMEMAKEDARRTPLPADLFEREDTGTDHELSEGGWVEAIDPHGPRITIEKAQVVKVSGSRVQLEANGQRWWCIAPHPFILKAKDTCGVQNADGPKTKSDEPSANGAPVVDGASDKNHTTDEVHNTTWPDATELGFEANMRLEAADPLDPSTIGVASVARITGHLVWLEPEWASREPFACSTATYDMFPAGWCETNGYQLRTPLQRPPVGRPKGRKDAPPPPPPQEEEESHRSWCPKIYFNPQCYSGPFLSKGKLTQLPKSVGPGPVSLVMREVLGMLVSVAYKSSRVLREIQSESETVPGTHTAILKAKYKSNCYRANVSVVTSAERVPDFCRQVCRRLLCCPHLFGPEPVPEVHCAENCARLAKQRFAEMRAISGKKKVGRPCGTSSNMVPKPKRKRGRRRFGKAAAPPMAVMSDDAAGAESPIQNPTIGAAPGVGSGKKRGMAALADDDEEDEEKGKVEPNNKRRYVKREFPRSEIKTRGAKLPNFALQMRASHWLPRKRSASNSESTSTNSSQSSGRGTPARQTKLHVPKSEDGASLASPRLPPALGPPPVGHSPVEPPPPVLESNPLTWSAEDVCNYLRRQEDSCKQMAKRLQEEEVDGRAFLLLNLPTLQEHLGMRLGPAVKLCRHVEKVKLAFFTQYAFSGHNQL